MPAPRPNAAEGRRKDASSPLAVAPQVAQRRIPTVLVIVDLCRANATFPIKIDFRMTTEHLRESAFQLFQTFCRDNGVPFRPPSLRPVDYTLLPCFEDGQIDMSLPPLQLAALGGATLRDQMAHLPTPCYVSMVIGQQWLERDALQREEEDWRLAVVQKRDETLSSMEYFADISHERALEQQHMRERHESAVAKAEDVLCYLFVAWSRHERKLQHERRLLQLGEQLWAEQCAAYAQEVDGVEREKRKFFQSSVIHVATLEMAVLNATADHSDKRRAQVLQLLQDYTK